MNVVAFTRLKLNKIGKWEINVGDVELLMKVS